MPTRYRPPARLKLGHAEAILRADDDAIDTLEERYGCAHSEILDTLCDMAHEAGNKPLARRLSRAFYDLTN